MEGKIHMGLEQQQFCKWQFLFLSEMSLKVVKSGLNNKDFFDSQVSNSCLDNIFTGPTTNEWFTHTHTHAHTDIYIYTYTTIYELKTLICYLARKALMIQNIFISNKYCLFGIFIYQRILKMYVKK